MGRPGELMSVDSHTHVRTALDSLSPSALSHVPGAQGCCAQRPQGQAQALWSLQAKQCPEVHGSQRHSWERGRWAPGRLGGLSPRHAHGQPARALGKMGKVRPDLSHGASCPGGVQVYSRGGGRGTDKNARTWAR